MSLEVSNCLTCSSVAERAKVINSLIKNQHEMVSSLLRERRASSTARTIVSELKRQNEFLSQECTKISEEYRNVLEKVAPLQKRYAEIESELGSKEVEIESYVRQLEIARNAPSNESAAESKASALQLKIEKLENKVKRFSVQKRQCTRVLKSLVRLKSVVGSDEARRAIENLLSVSGVGLDSLELEGAQLEQILENESGTEEGAYQRTVSGVESASQTESALQTHRICQTSPIATRNRESQTETKLDMPILSNCEAFLLPPEPAIPDCLAQPPGASEGQMQPVFSALPENTPVDKSLGKPLSCDMVSGEVESKLDLLDVVLMEHRGGTPGGLPGKTPDPHKNEKHVRFMDHEKLEWVELATTAAANDPTDEAGDLDRQLSEEVERILAEMRNPFGDSSDNFIVLSPMPPSPEAFGRKSKKKSRSPKRSRQLLHPTPIGSEPAAAPPSQIPAPAPLPAATPQADRLRAEVTHTPNAGLTTFCFQIPCRATSKVSFEFDQATKHVTFSCSEQTAGTQGEQGSGDVSSSTNYNVATDRSSRTSDASSIPERIRRFSTGTLGPKSSNSDEKYSQHGFPIGSKRTFPEGLEYPSLGIDDVHQPQQEDKLEQPIAPIWSPPQLRTIERHDERPLEPRISAALKIPSLLKKDSRLKRLSRHKNSQPLVRELQKKILKRSMDANILEAKEKMLQRRVESEKADASLPAVAEVAEGEFSGEVGSEVAAAAAEFEEPVDFPVVEDIETPKHSSTEPQDETARSQGQSDAREEEVLQQEIAQVRLEPPREQFAVEIIDCVTHPPPRWELRTWDGGKQVDATPNCSTANGDSDEDPSMYIDFSEDILDSPLSPEDASTSDRALTKLIPSEFIEEIAAKVYALGKKTGQQQSEEEQEQEQEEGQQHRLPLPPASPPAAAVSEGSPMVTRGKLRPIPTSPTSISSDKRNTRSSLRTSAKKDELEQQQPLPRLEANLETTEHSGKLPQTASLGVGRRLTRSQPKVMSLLKDSYVAEKEEYPSNNLSHYDDFSAAKETTSAELGNRTRRVESLQTVVGYFRQKNGRFPSVEETLLKVAHAQVATDEALSAIDLEHTRKLYVSFVYVLLDLNRKLTLPVAQNHITDAERNLVTFLLEGISPKITPNKSASSSVGVNCINYIRGYITSLTDPDRTIFKLTSVLKVLSYLVSKLSGEWRQLVDEIYYSMMDFSSETAYQIGCLLAGWSQCLDGIRIDSPFGFVVRYVLFHHVSTLPCEDLRTAREMALNAGWTPLVDEGHSISNAIERFAPAIFANENKKRSVSRVALRSLEIMFILLGDIGITKKVMETYVPDLLQQSELPERDISTLLQFCGKIWAKFTNMTVEKLPFEATVESLMTLNQRLKGSKDKGDIKEFCQKALWSYSTYDSSESGTRARQVCTQDRIMQAKGNLFFRRGKGRGGKQPSKTLVGATLSKRMSKRKRQRKSLNVNTVKNVTQAVNEQTRK